MTALSSLYDAPLKQKLRLLRALAMKLDALHRHGLAHGALSINEILVADDDEVVLLNALTPQVRSSLEGPLFLVSSLPPETVDAHDLSGALTDAGDMWSLGVVGYQLLTKVHPFVVRELPEPRKPRSAQPDVVPTDWAALADDLFNETGAAKEDADDRGLAASWPQRIQRGEYVPLGQLVAVPAVVERIFPRLLSRLPADRPSAKNAAAAFAAGAELK